MKKLIIAVAVVCTAVLTHAAAFNWSTDDKAYMPYAIGSLVKGANQAAATSTNNKSMSNWADAGAVFTYTMLIDGTESTGTVTYNSRKIDVAANNDGFELPTEGSKTFAYDIVINGTYTDGDGTAWTMTSDHITGTTDPYSSLSAASLATAVPSSWTITATPAPEPTSGLLLLLGVAGLALRRKRA